MIYKKLLIFLFALFSSALYAKNSDYIQQLQKEAERNNLWQQPEWLNLLHYRQAHVARQQFESSIDDNSFFLAATGKNNPKLELKATLSAFFKTEENDNNQALCRFVARFSWLSHRLAIKKSRLPKVECKDYKTWRKMIPSEQVTMIFPAYHLNSPSSMFGHTLLRLDPSEDESWSDWLSFSINFGANISNSDNSVAYAYKGLTGGYPGQFIVTPYYTKILEYSRIERRDIWEYQLNLMPEEVERLVKHLWELKEVNFDYFFFTENCSYRLLELLEVARPGIELTDEFVVTAIPVDTVRAVEQAGMIEEVKYRPSRERVLQSMIETLDENERTVLINLIQYPDIEYEASFSRLPENKQRFLAETAYKLLRFRQNKQVRDQSAARKSHQLLSIINRYPVGVEQPVARPVQPEKSHHSKQLALKVGERDKINYTELGFRMSFHSLEDNELGFLRGAQINIASVRLRRSEKSTLFLQQLDFADIFSLTPRTQFFDPLSWRVRGGLERVHRSGKDRLVSHISGGGGYAWNLTSDGIAYTLLTARIEANNEFKHSIEPALGAAAGFLLHNDIGTGKLELASEKFSGGTNSTRLKYEQNWVLARDHAIKLSFKREWYSNKQLSEVGLSYQFHF